MKGNKFFNIVNFRKALGGAVIGGFIVGLLGVGGGVIFVPVLTSIAGLPAHIGFATSTFIIIFTAISGSISRIFFGPFQNQIWLFKYVLFLAIGTVTGARLGALKVRLISSEKILIIFNLIVFVTDMRTVASGLGFFFLRITKDYC